MASPPLDCSIEEVERLQSSLKEALREKYEAAQYGLKLLEEKESLQSKLEESEEKLVHLMRELQLTREKCDEQSELQRKISQAGFQEEDDLLSRSANREEQLSHRIKDLEHDLKSTKAKYENQMAENDKLHQIMKDLQAKYDSVEKIRQDLKQEMKGMKSKEAQLLSELDELESENLELQKNVLALKTSQIEFESLKHELKRGQEENDLIHVQLEEVTRLKRITEKSLEEALESLQIEREQRHNLKKELDSRLAYESFYHLNSIQNGLAQVSQSQLLNQTNSRNASILETSKSADVGGQKSAAAGENLLSELQTSELTQFKAELAELQRKLEEAQRSAEVASSEVTSKQERITQLQTELDIIMGVQRRADAEFEAKNEANGADTADDDLGSRRALRQAETRYSVALRQIASMQHDLWRYQELERMNADPALTDDKGLKAEVLRLREQLEKKASDIKKLEDRIDNGAVEAQEIGLKSASVSSSLRVGFSELLKLYMLICAEIKETPSKQVSDLASRAAMSLDTVTKATTDDSTASDPAVDGAVSIPISTDPVTPEMLAKQAEDQTTMVGHLRHVIQMFAEKNARLAKTAASGGASQDVEELQAEILSLKSKLSTKRDQVIALRDVLKANKTTAETALANLKQKYENEKMIVTDTMRGLRSELKVLKEDAVTYASIRAMFAQKHDEFVTQMDELQQKLNSAEDEKRTLNSLLRLAIQQKLHLTQRLEEYEVAQITPDSASARYPAAPTSTASYSTKPIDSV
uniref:Protein bicaudal D homolog 2-like n=2 Tax=Mesocestoides corti TaxID=53468 RepID=A0A5K3FTP4_MESCO